MSKLLPNQRELFSIPRDVAYLNCAYMSPQLRSVEKAGVAALARKSVPWTIRVDDFFADSERLRELFAGLIGATADDIALVPSVSYGIGTAARNVHVGRGEKILLLEDQFPSNVYPWRSLSQETGAEILTVPRPGDGDWTQAVLDRLDDRVAIAALPAVHWTDGGLVDLARVGQRCREAGVALVLDLTQSLGAMPFPLEEVQADFIVCAAYKWLLGPYSLGFMYVHPGHHDGRPLEEGWIAREGSEDFAGLVDYRDQYQSGARRFDVGERSNFALLPMAVRALEQIADWGVENIAVTLGRLTAKLAKEAGELGMAATPAEHRGPHLLGLQLPGQAGREVLDVLAREKIYVSLRGNSMRISPHLYNDEQDIDRLIAALAAIS